MLTNAVREGLYEDIMWRIAAHPDFFAWNGYVNLPEEHPWRDMEDWEIPTRVHGGITYGPDEDGWIGFDMMHLHDSVITLDGHDMDDDIRLFCLEHGLPEPRIEQRTFEDVYRETLKLAREACEAMKEVVA
ncbi:hypothetical protein [Bifidobacterium callitrichidarum]|uniref:Uncharacterized protein n=1 Tax=Bifidobacterium callitrichidarum TaxID=2052941 RepID=A0A2U2N8T9_9BIFI|nr:hypothetical protein [Bifidobacterium callitrichidarum]PWG65595.1 hypothetical protein DF196_06580 [Bifidobacterium callitrichidarum]